MSTARSAVAAPARVRSGAFGIVLESDAPVAGLPAASCTDATRTATWTICSSARLAAAARGAGWTTLVHLRHDDGTTFMQIERSDVLGYRIAAPHHGRHLVTADGSHILSAIPTRSPARWQRLFFAQPLPLAAALLGLDVFHASAVAIGGRAVALVAPSGTGKTSVAAHLVAGGAEFLTDDVLALEPSGAEITAHPGAARLAIDETELATLEPGARERLGAVVGRSDKLHLTVRPSLAAPLGAVYFLRRRDERPALGIEERSESVTRALLASAFLAYLRGPEQLIQHLEVCGRIAASVPTFEVAIPSVASAKLVAERLREHANAVLETT